jgi:hypothetical protein
LIWSSAIFIRGTLVEHSHDERQQGIGRDRPPDAIGAPRF